MDFLNQQPASRCHRQSITHPTWLSPPALVVMFSFIFVLKVQACCYGHTPQLLSELVVFVISEKPEGVVALHLPIGPFKKTHSRLEPVTRFELSIYQSDDLATVPSRPVMVFIQWVSYPVLVSSDHEDLLGWSQY